LAALYSRLRDVAWQVISFADRFTTDQARVIVELMLLTESLQCYLMQTMLANEEQEEE
jgi:hypothetical protein